jgi:hypothetical protein
MFMEDFIIIIPECIAIDRAWGITLACAHCVPPFTSSAALRSAAM